jgi:hypothetical protein
MDSGATDGSLESERIIHAVLKRLFEAVLEINMKFSNSNELKF